MPTSITPNQIGAIIAPFVGAKLKRHETLAEYKTRPCIDITVGCMNIVDCDVREVGSNGFMRPWGSKRETYTFDQVRSIKVYRWSEDQRSQIVSAEYVVDALQVAA